MKWRKLGLVFCPSGSEEWMSSHAAGPIANHLEGDYFKVYFSPRDAKKRSQIASLVLRMYDEKASVVEGSIEHVLSHGENGCFDDCGCTITSAVKDGKRHILYYVGWSLAITIPFRNAIGAAVSENGSGRFERVSLAPIFDRSMVDPISLGSCSVLKEYDKYRMWYGSCISWKGHTVKDYNVQIKYAESKDGFTWNPFNKIVLVSKYPEEDKIGKPHVIYENNYYKMWYSYKKGRYFRMGYAESENGMKWERMDEKVGIDVSDSGWDSEMIEYPFIFDHKRQRYMLYNGNEYGKTGFGLAVLEKP